MRHYLPDTRLDTRRLFQCAAEDLRDLDMLVPLSSITRCTTRLCPPMSFSTLQGARLTRRPSWIWDQANPNPGPKLGHCPPASLHQRLAVVTLALAPTCSR